MYFSGGKGDWLKSWESLHWSFLMIFFNLGLDNEDQADSEEMLGHLAMLIWILKYWKKHMVGKYIIS